MTVSENNGTLERVTVSLRDARLTSRIYTRGGGRIDVNEIRVHSNTRPLFFTVVDPATRYGKGSG